MFGGAFGGNLALLALDWIPGVRAVGMLTPFVRAHAKRLLELANTRPQPILLITSEGFGPVSIDFASRVAEHPRHTVRNYPGGHIGYLLFKVDPSLEPAIAAWFEERLG